ncbi:MAG: radical SAM protein [Candidatus Nanoarchaeia archaeon]|nr:radical SAM protein [Candidatus Nanoarchaeia archaeon]
MKDKIKFLFLNMVNPQRATEKLYPPLGPAYLVSYIKKYLKDSDKIEFSMISGNFEENIKNLKPDILGITCVSQNYEYAKKIAKFSKKIGIKYVLIGGSHISLCPSSLDKNIDIGVIGEGEETFLELIKLYLKNQKFTISGLAKIKGIGYWNNNLKFTKKRELMPNIDIIPLPDRSLFKIDSDEAYMFSSRGCPYKCVFCASSRLWEKVRFHSAKYVFNEIKELINKYHVKKISFWDDLFIANKQRVKELVKLLEKEKITGTVEFHVRARANLVDDAICSLLKKMNVKSVSMGLESGSPKILNYLKGDSVNVAHNFNAVETIKKYGMYCSASFVIGTPLDTKETIMETLNFIKKSKLDDFEVYTLTPFPGTPVWDYAIKKKLISKKISNFNWKNLDIDYSKSHQYNIHMASNITKEELYSLYLEFEKEKRKRKLIKIAKNPFKIIRFIKKKLFEKK